jgi:glucokinase
VTGGRAVGVDVGGTGSSAVLLDVSGRVHARAAAATPAAEGGDAVLACVARLVHEVDPHGSLPVGVGATGVVDPVAGVVVAATSAMPGWAGTPVAERLPRLLPRHRAVVVLNDVHAFLVAESRVGAGAGETDILGVTVGTGIGGALLAGGDLVTGRRGAAGHVGHVPVPGAAGLLCPCGARGHVEAVSAAPALLATYSRVAVGRGLAAAADLAEVARRAEAGEATARDVLADGGRHLGEALAGVVAVCSPAVVVVGGGVAAAGELFLGPLRRALAAHAHPVVADVPVLPAALGVDAVAVGAGLHALVRAGTVLAADDAVAAGSRAVGGGGAG